MLAVLDQGSPRGAASDPGVAVQAAAAARAPQQGEDAAGSHKTAGCVASTPPIQSVHFPAPCCCPHSGQLAASAVMPSAYLLQLWCMTSTVYLTSFIEHAGHTICLDDLHVETCMYQMLSASLAKQQSALLVFLVGIRHSAIGSQLGHSE